jgi:hypothetical protein
MPPQRRGILPLIRVPERLAASNMCDTRSFFVRDLYVVREADREDSYHRQGYLS